MWFKRQRSSTRSLPALREERTSSWGVTLESHNLNASLLTEPSEIETLLSDARCPFDGITYDADSSIIQASTLQALKDGCTLNYLIEYCPDDVLTVLKEMSVAKHGTFTASDSKVLRAFGSHRRMLTRGLDFADDPYWRSEWKELIEERAMRSDKHSNFTVGWEQSVTLGAYVVHLRDIAKRKKGNLLKLLLEKCSAGAASKDIWESPSIQAVVNYHWDHWARKLILAIFLFFLLWVLCFASYVTVYIESRDPPTNPSNSTTIGSSINQRDLSMPEVSTAEAMTNDGSSGHARIFGSFSDRPLLASLTHIFNILCFGLMCPFGIEEYLSIFAQRWQWFRVQNLVDIVSINLQAFIFACHMADYGLLERWFGIILAIQAVALAARLLRFVRIIGEGTEFFDTSLAVIYNVRYWLMYVVFSGITASFALGALYKTDDNFHGEHRDFGSVKNSLVTTFQIIFGTFNTFFIFDAHYSWTAFLIFFGFQVLMTVTVLNLIIAAMAESYTKLASRRVSQHFRVRATVIEELAALKLQIFCPVEPAPFIHFLVVERKHQAHTRPESAAVRRSPELVMRGDDDLRRKVDDLSAKVEIMMRMLESMTHPTPRLAQI